MQARNIGMNRTPNLDEENERFAREHLPSVLRNDGSIHPFDGDKIKDSILKETSASERIADIVTERVVTEILTSRYTSRDIVTAGHIREVSCCVLQDIRKKLRSQYTRLGMSFYDFERNFGGIFDEFDDLDDLTEQNIMEKVIAVMNPSSIVKFFTIVGRDYKGIRNDIRAFESEERDRM